VFNSTKVNGKPANGTCSISEANLTAHCVKTKYPPNELCTKRSTGAISYTEFAGLMLGMVLFGLICDVIGRRSTSIITALLEVFGLGVMVFYVNPNLYQQTIVTAVFYGVFGIGMGGEYPLTAYGAAQHYFRSLAEKEYEAEHDEREKMRKRVLIEQAKTARRGETIALIFTMQGVGAVFGSAILLALIYFSGQGRTNW
jgi:MFS family permease